MKRWSLYGGIRYDSFKNSFPAQDLLPTQFVPNRPVVHFPEQDNISWNDITPKLGASYDLFGNGKTAIKVSLNKYLLGYGTAGFFENGLSSNPHPINTLADQQYDRVERREPRLRTAVQSAESGAER